jgi:putative hydrolase of the HAD superfamily
MAVRRIDTLIFDLGNVLIFHDNRFLCRRLAEKAGLASAEVERLISPDFWAAVHGGAVSAEELRRQVCATLGLELTASAFDELWACHFRVNQPMLPQVEALVGRVKLLALSNTNAIHARYVLLALPVLKRFDQVLFSHELGMIKPDPEIFREALRRAKSEADATAFFDDIPEYVEAARSVGIHGKLFRSAAEFPAQLAQLGL